MKKPEENIINCSISSILVNDTLWLLSYYTNTLLKYDWISKELISIYSIPEEIFPFNAHMQMVNVDNNIFVVPNKGELMYKFDIEKEIFEEIKIPLLEGESKVEGKFSHKIILGYNDTICFFGQRIKGIFFYDIRNKSFKRELSYINILRKRGYNVENVGWNDYYQDQEKVYLTVFNYNHIFCINLKTKQIEEIEIESDKEIKLTTITEYNNKFLLTTADEKKIIWSKDLGIESLDSLNNITNIQFRFYRKVFHINNKNYYFVSCKRKVFVEDEGFREIKFDIPTTCRYPEGYTQFETIFRENDKIYFQMRENGMLYQLDPLNDKIDKVELKIPLSKKQKLENRSFVFIGNNQINENEVYSLKGWINNLKLIEQ